MLHILDGLEERGDLLATEYHGQLLWLFGEGHVLDQVLLAQTDAVEKAQGADALIEHGPGTLTRNSWYSRICSEPSVSGDWPKC